MWQICIDFSVRGKEIDAISLFEWKNKVYMSIYKLTALSSPIEGMRIIISVIIPFIYMQGKYAINISVLVKLINIKLRRWTKCKNNTILHKIAAKKKQKC